MATDVLKDCFVLLQFKAHAGVWSSRQSCQQHRHLQFGGATSFAQAGRLAGVCSLLPLRPHLCAYMIITTCDAAMHMIDAFCMSVCLHFFRVHVYISDRL